MKLKSEVKEQKLPFTSWILFDPMAFKVIFIMSMGVGILICSVLMFLTWKYNWGSEIMIIISIITVFNIYTAIKQIRTAKYADTSINEMVYSGKYKPKKIKINKKTGHDMKWPSKGGK